MDQSPSRKVIAVDICNTLFDSNTTFDFITYCIKAGKLPGSTGLLNKLLLSKASSLFYGVLALQKISRRDLFKEIVVQYLKGRSVVDVNAWSEQFYTEFLEPRTIKSTLGILRQFDRNEVLLVSSTLWPIASVIARRLNIPNYLATELAVQGGRYTGKIAQELSGRKLTAIQQRFQKEVKIAVVMTDNFTDMELMKASEQCFAVCYNAKQEQFWSVLPQVTIVNIPGPYQN